MLAMDSLVLSLLLQSKLRSSIFLFRFCFALFLYQEHMSFIKPDICIRHWAALRKRKEDLLYSVNRDNISDSLADFVDQSGELIAEMEDREGLRRNRFAYFLLKGRWWWYFCSLMLCICLNIWILVDCSAPDMMTEASMKENNQTWDSGYSSEVSISGSIGFFPF